MRISGCRGSGRGSANASPSGAWDAPAASTSTSNGVASRGDNGMFAPSGGRSPAWGAASSLPPRHEALSFIRAHSDDPEDLLPGLCLFIEQWLDQVGAVHWSSHRPPDIHVCLGASRDIGHDGTGIPAL